MNRVRIAILVAAAVVCLTACPGRPVDISGVWTVSELEIPNSVQTWTFFDDGTVTIDTILYPAPIEGEYRVRGRVVTVTGLARAIAAPPMQLFAELTLFDNESRFAGNLTLTEGFIPPRVFETEVFGARGVG